MLDRYRKAAIGLGLSALAFLWRRLMFRTTFIVVTGSYGKTMTTRGVAAILSSCFGTNSTRGANNSRIGLALSILRTRYSHSFTVLEVGTQRPGALKRAAWLIEPDVVVVLCVARAHTENFVSLDHIAVEKAQLLSRMRPDGVAILNGDDARVLSMAGRCPGRVRTFGQSAGFDVWASDVSSRWPSGLSFIVHADGQSLPVHTQFFGQHWVTTALAALSVALCCGVTLPNAVSALERAETYPGRVQPCLLPSGAVVLRDDYNWSIDSMLAALRVLRDAEARRRVLVIGDVEDSGQGAPDRHEALGQAAAESAELAVFFGEHSASTAKAALAVGMEPQNVHSFPTQREAGEFLKRVLGNGDLVLLRRSRRDHPERIYYAQFGTVECTKVECQEDCRCDECAELRPSLELAEDVPKQHRPRWEHEPK